MYCDSDLVTSLVTHVSRDHLCRLLDVASVLHWFCTILVSESFNLRSSSRQLVT